MELELQNAVFMLLCEKVPGFKEKWRKDLFVKDYMILKPILISKNLY